MRGARLAVFLLALGLPGVVLAPVWRIAGLGAGEDDVLYYFPSRVWFSELCAATQPPWLNPWNGLDRPLYADPQSAITYPASWLFAVLPTATAYPLILWLHYSLALLGMYRLLRASALDRRAALLGGIAFAFCGFMLAHRAHFTMQQAAAWMPFVFWRTVRYVTLGGNGRFVIAAVVAAAQCFAGHIQIAALTALGTIIFLLASSPLHRRVAWRWVIVWLGAAGLFAVQLIPTYLHLRECTRTTRSYLDFCENSYWPSSAIGWVMPMLFGQRTPNFFQQAYWGPSHQVEQFSYMGVVPLLLAAAALRPGWRGDPRRRGWVILLIFALLTALGMFGPVCPLLYWLPGASIFRVPARTMLLANLAVAALAAISLHDLSATLTPGRAQLRAALIDWSSKLLRILLASVAAPLALVILSLPLIPEPYRSSAWSSLRPWNSAVWVPVLTVGASLALIGWVARHWDRPRLLALASAATVIDLSIIGWTIDVPAGARTATDLLTSPTRDEWLRELRDSPGRLWVVARRSQARGALPAEYIDPLGKCSSNTNILDHVAALTDYGPLTPRNFARVFDFKPWGEAVAPDELLADGRWMQRFRVGWLLLCAPDLEPPAGAQSLSETAGYRLFRYDRSRGAAFFDDAAQPGAIRIVEQAPHRFTTFVDTWPDADEPQTAQREWPRLVVSRLALTGWTATCNGARLTIQTSDGCLLSVRLPRWGTSVIEWRYFPPGLIAGAVITAATALLLAWFVFKPPARRRE